MFHLNVNNIINLLFQTIVHMDIKKNIYKTHIINKLKIIRINGNQSNM